MFQAYQRPEDLGKSMRILGDDFMQVSDGYHTIEELYDHRVALFIALCRQFEKTDIGHEISMPKNVWCSRLHSDGSSYDGWFILGLFHEKGKQITYHIPERFWDECVSFCMVLENAPEYDGHTSADVLERLKNL